jgi:hypothetical protein
VQSNLGGVALASLRPGKVGELATETETLVFGFDGHAFKQQVIGFLLKHHQSHEVCTRRQNLNVPLID